MNPLCLLEKSDGKIVGFVERISWKIEGLIGLNNFFFARLFLLAFFVFGLVSKNVTQSIFVLVPFTVLIFLIAIQFAEYMDKKYPLYVSAVRYDIKCVFCRCFILIVTILAPSIFYDYSAWLSRLFFVLSIYLTSCKSLPPGESKLRKFVKNLSFGRKNIEIMQS